MSNEKYLSTEHLLTTLGIIGLTLWTITIATSQALVNVVIEKITQKGKKNE